MPFAAALLSLLATLILSVLAAASSPQASALPGGSALAADPTPVQTPTITPTILPRPPMKCLQKKMVSYCIPNTSKFQVCSPTVKQVECPIDSFCRETKDAKGNTFAYCKYIG